MPELINVGLKKNGYRAMDGLSLTDLLGNNRLNRRSVDIGCFEGVKNPGFMLFFR